MTDPNSKAYQFIDPTTTWFPAYKRQIKNIMDFRTLKRKYQDQLYPTIHEFSNDMRLIWDNALRFNHPQETIWSVAWDFLKLWEERFLKEAVPIVGPLPNTHIYRQVLDEIWSAPDCHYFQGPVNYVALRLPTYPEMIKKPFCLKQVRDRICSMKTPTEFFRTYEFGV
eukprot:UN32644